MKFEFTGRHIEVTPALRTHVEEHLTKIEHLFDGRPPKIHVIIEVERGRHRSEIVINWRNEALTAESRNSDMYQSLSQTIGKIEKQARKLKDKVIDKSHKARKAAVVATPRDAVEKTVRLPKIIEMNGLGSKPMSPEEAAMELDDSDQQFFVFRTSKQGKVAVIFRRKDGNYGLVQP
ncbi:MAG: ribosome-associated translation inhibitor RaiA [Acidobacteriota bacterium]